VLWPVKGVDVGDGREPEAAGRVAFPMDGHRIDPRTDTGRDPGETGTGVAAAAFREALSHWASSVTLVAVRDEAQVHATTVTSFFPVSAEPPLVAVSLGAGAQVLPWLDPGTRFAVSILAADQAGLAVRYADPFPVGPPPFPAEGDPVVEGAVAALVCEVVALHPTEGGARLVLARVVATPPVEGGLPLLRHRRRYASLDPER
jgi:flavin reductase (DIM6/NTAB) family NADH-FMN oxidoreductase RutF